MLYLGTRHAYENNVHETNNWEIRREDDYTVKLV
jgi:hypothetical protein